MFPVINFNNSDITKAGKTLANNESNLLDIQEAEAIINDWRKYHYWPIMTIQGTLRNHVRRMSVPQAIVAQRLKKCKQLKINLDGTLL